MAWEWVAPVATLASGVTGIWFTYKSGRNQAKSQLEALLRQSRESHRAEILKDKRQLYSDYLGSLAEAGYTAALIMDRTEDKVKYTMENLSPEVRAKIADLVPSDIPEDEREPYIDSLIESASRRVLKQRVEDRVKRGYPQRDPFLSIDFTKLFSLASRVEMIGGSSVAEYARQPIVALVQVTTDYPKPAKRLGIVGESTDHLARLMKQDLEYAPENI